MPKTNHHSRLGRGKVDRVLGMPGGRGYAGSRQCRGRVSRRRALRLGLEVLRGTQGVSKQHNRGHRGRPGWRALCFRGCTAAE